MIFKNAIAFIYVVLVILAFAGTECRAEGKSGVEPQVISLPKGPGSIEGLGESFEPQLNTGTATYGLKIKVSPGVGKFQPEVSLSYNGGNGNSVVGMGWSLSGDYIQRQTDKGVPAYTDSDTFISGGGELVPLGAGVYRQKIEGSFMKFMKNGDTWEVRQKNGTHLYFGLTGGARQSNPFGTFKWLLEKSVDLNGNEIRYSYVVDQGLVYLSEIRYSIMSASDCKAVQFLYENRPDVFTDYHSRSAVTTAKRLKGIEIRSQGALVRRYELAYFPLADFTLFSLLASVTQYGQDDKTTLPPLAFDYSRYQTGNLVAVPLVNAPTWLTLSDPNVDLVDIDGDSLPDIVHTSPADGLYRFYINAGAHGGQLTMTADPIIPDASPPHLLADYGVMMADMNGDGRADLFVKNLYDFGYFRNTGALKWESADFVQCSPQTDINFRSMNVRMMDVNNDKLIDLIVDDGTSYNVWLNNKNNNWNTNFDYSTTIPDGSHPMFNDPATKLGDMNGDRMQDLVVITDGYAAYYPNMGNGQFGSKIEIQNPPTLPGWQSGKIMLADINNDGLDDVVLIGDGAITVWFNAGNNSFKDPKTFTDIPPFSAAGAAYRFADVNGDGFRDLLINDPGAPEPYFYLDFNNGVTPNILTNISNGLGQVTTISYKSSTDDYIAARDAGNPWTTKLPFPVPVVSKVEVKDLNSSMVYTTDYTYRDGYYDGEQKQFRGFGQVDKVTSGEAGAPPLKSHYVFDVGNTEESRKGMVLSLAALEATGTISPPSGLFDREDNSITTSDPLFIGTNGEKVRFSYTSSKTRSIYEKGTTPSILYQEFKQDNYGNTIEEFNYGKFSGTKDTYSNDEILTYTDYYHDDLLWVHDRPKQVRKTTLLGGFISTQKNFYDEGLTWNLLRQEGSPDGTTFIPLVRNKYDTWGNITTITDANGHYRDIGYDTTFHTFPISESIGGLGLSLFASYDLGLGVVKRYTDFNGNYTDYGYDPLGRLTEIIKPGDTLALPTQHYVYTLGSPVSSVRTQSRTSSGKAATYDSISYYDGLGRKLQTRSDGETLGNWVVSDAVRFNQQKGIKEKWLPYFDSTMAYTAPPTAKTVRYEYDAKGRSVKETNPDDSFRTTKYEPLSKTEYDEEDNVVGGPHANTPHTFVNDGLDRLVTVKENNGGSIYTTSYGYDGLNNLTKVTDNEGNVKTITFDGLGRKTAMNDPDRHAMSYHYDDAGNLLDTTDAKNQKVSYLYDPANRIVSESFGGATKVHYHYDTDLSAKYPGMTNTKGKLAWVEDEAGSEYYSYDSRGNTVQKTREAAGLTFTNRMAYDAMDRLNQLTYPDNFTLSYLYNGMNQLESIPGFVSAIDYIPTGHKSRFVYANGLESRYQYDSRQRMTGMKTVKGAQIYQDLGYGYDKTSNITDITDGRQAKSTEDLTRAYKYDDLYRLNQATAPAWSESYQYSSIGNMTFKSDLGIMSYGGNGAGPHALTRAAGANLNYGYDANGNIATKSPGFSYSFDQNDRMAGATRTNDGIQVSHTYDFGGNRVTKSVKSGSTTATTVYADKYTEVRGDTLIKQIFAGNRLVARVFSPFSGGFPGRAVPLTVADFDRNKDGIISVDEIRLQGSDPARMEANDVADALNLYYANLDNPASPISFATMATALHEQFNVSPTTQNSYFYLPDHLGSANIVTDTTGAIVEESVQYPYGAERAKTGTFNSSYRFTGKELDSEIGLHYFGARYYDSQSGRFVSVDPMIQAFSEAKKEKNDSFLRGLILNESYSYAGNNPIRYVDPNGMAKDEAYVSRNSQNYENSGGCDANCQKIWIRIGGGISVAAGVTAFVLLAPELIAAAAASTMTWGAAATATKLSLGVVGGVASIVGGSVQLFSGTKAPSLTFSDIRTEYSIEHAKQNNKPLLELIAAGKSLVSVGTSLWEHNPFEAINSLNESIGHGMKAYETNSENKAVKDMFSAIENGNKAVGSIGQQP